MGCDEFPVLPILRKCFTALKCVSSIGRVSQYQCTATSRASNGLHRAPANHPIGDILYNTAEVLQVESPMNNGKAAVSFICCVDTDTVAALLMGPRLSCEVAFFTPIFLNQ